MYVRHTCLERTFRESPPLLLIVIFGITSDYVLYVVVVVVVQEVRGQKLLTKTGSCSDPRHLQKRQVNCWLASQQGITLEKIYLVFAICHLDPLPLYKHSVVQPLTRFFVCVCVGMCVFVYVCGCPCMHICTFSNTEVNQSTRC